MRHILKTLNRGFSSRRQNFFEMNPIYPSAGEKDFDVYNVDRKLVPVANIASGLEHYRQKLKDKIVNTFIIDKFKAPSKEIKARSIDEMTGLPLGRRLDYDIFIEVFNRQQKLGANLFSDYGELMRGFMKKMKFTGEIELMKMYRLTIAKTRVKLYKDKLKYLLLQEAVVKTALERGNLKEIVEKAEQEYDKTHPEAHKIKFEQDPEKDESLPEVIEKTIQDSINEFSKEYFSKVSQKLPKGHLTDAEIEEILTRIFLNHLDEKIEHIELLKKATAITGARLAMPKYHPEFGEEIKELVKCNPRFDMKTQLGIAAEITTNQSIPSYLDQQDAFIALKLNKNYFNHREQSTFSDGLSAKTKSFNKLPIRMREADKFINQIAFMYNEPELVIEPDIEDIYKQIDIVLDQTSSTSHTGGGKDLGADLGDDLEKQRLLKISDRAHFLWDSLQTDEVFNVGQYEASNLRNVDLEEKEIRTISPFPVVELSLNRLPFNLYRHEDLQIFGIFQKQKAKIYKDFVQDDMVDPSMFFQPFSLDQVQRKYKKVLRGSEAVKTEAAGEAKRKTARAQVELKEGTGKVTINNKALSDYFGDVYHRAEALKPLIFTDIAGTVDVFITVVGGGAHGQSECIASALSKAIVRMYPKHKRILHGFGLLQTDDRRKEAKKMGLYSARKRPPYVRR